MRRFRDKILLPAAVCIAAVAGLAGCTNDTVPAQGEEDAMEIRLKGISTKKAATRAGTAGETEIYLVAFNGGDMTKRYFDRTRITSADSLDTSEQALRLATARYYPLGDNQINLFAFTGSINSNREMELEAGVGDAHDYVLSNHGRSSTTSGLVNTPEGEGTPGSATEPADLLQFRHVMTQLTVLVEVDTTQSNYVDPAPTKVEFEIDGMHRNGLYPITAVTPDPNSGSVETAVPNGGAPYRAQLGINYLVPTGLDLVGQNFSSLVIDDYVATDEDLKKFTITGDDAQMLLYPGYAYRLTLKIQKLKVVGVVLEQVDWIEEDIYGYEPTYDPHILNLNITGGYENDADDRITKVVLHSDEVRQYVGQLDETADDLHFVTLPADNRVVSVDLYTSKGLLITMDVDPSQYAGNTLNLALSEVGMLLLDPANPGNSESNPYLITTLVQFFNIEKQLGGHYRQDTDLELEKLDTSGASSSFTGFGAFSGTYDGNGYWIGDLDISCQGLFAANSGTLLNIRLYTGNMDVSGHTYAGALCGVNSGTIYACVNEAQLFGATGTVGGICGLNQGAGRVVACVNTGNIRAGDIIGGICGENQNTATNTFVACLSIGNISAGTTTTGAIIGQSTDAPSTVVINTCFWLEGSVESIIGSPEGPVGIGNVGVDEVAGLDPDKMRNNIDERETEGDRVVNKLNDVLVTDPDYYPAYSYVWNPALTGITWPMPFK